MGVWNESIAKGDLMSGRCPFRVRDRFEFNWDPHGETLVAPFEVAPGVVIPPGAYDFTRWRLEAQTSEHRPLQFGTTRGSAPFSTAT